MKVLENKVPLVTVAGQGIGWGVWGFEKVEPIADSRV